MDIVRWIEYPRASLCAKQLFCHRVQGERSFAKVMLEKFCFLGEGLGLTTVSLNKRCQPKGKGEKGRYFFFFANYVRPCALQFLEAIYCWGPISSEGNQAEGNQPKSPDLALGTQFSLPTMGPKSRNLFLPMKSRPFEMTNFWGKVPIEFQETRSPSD